MYAWYVHTIYIHTFTHIMYNYRSVSSIYIFNTQEHTYMHALLQMQHSCYEVYACLIEHMTVISVSQVACTSFNAIIT